MKTLNSEYLIRREDGAVGKYIIVSVCYMALWTLPFFSLPIAPVLYRPVSAVFLMCLSPLVVYLPGRLLYSELVLLIFAAGATIQSFIMIWILRDLPADFVRNTLPLWMGCAAYFGSVAAIYAIGLSKAIKILWKTGIVLVVVGYIELISNLLGMSAFKELLSYFSGASHTNRIQLFTREASWAAKCLVFYIPFIELRASSKRSLLWRFAPAASWMLFLAVFSLDGIGGAIFGALLFVILNGIRTRRLFSALKFPVAIAFLVILFAVFREEIASQISGSGLYFLDRVGVLLGERNLGHAISNFAYHDNSTFIRLFYPLAGFQMFLDEPLGRGLGAFTYDFQNYIPLQQINLEFMPEIEEGVYAGIGDPKSMYAKIAAECGLFTGPLFVTYLILCGYSAYSSRGPLRRTILLSFCMTLGVLIQFGSFLYLPMWITFAFCLHGELLSRRDCSRTAVSPRAGGFKK